MGCQNQQELGNMILHEEMAHNLHALEEQNNDYSKNMNESQNKIYNVVLDVVHEAKGGLYFLYGHGGTGETYVYKAIINRLHSEGKIVLAVASSAIASLLLPGGRTAHSRFKIPIDIHEESSFHIKKGTHIAELMAKANLIVWDEASMAHRHCFEALDRSLSEILMSEDGSNINTPFGGKAVLLGGDFRQILPVVVKGTRQDTVRACITRSHLWQKCSVFYLTENMRLSPSGLNSVDLAKMSQFARWLLDIGEGNIE